jgi:hypothetical protein
MNIIPHMLIESLILTLPDVKLTTISSILNGHLTPMRTNKHMDAIEITKKECEKLNLTGRLSCIPISVFPYKHDKFEDYKNGWYMVHLNRIIDEYDVDIYTCVLFRSGIVTEFTNPV